MIKCDYCKKEVNDKDYYQINIKMSGFQICNGTPTELDIPSTGKIVCANCINIIHHLTIQKLC